MEVGQVMCLKTSGELVAILKITEDATTIRRPVMTQDGIEQTVMEVYSFELETIEEHLRREGKEMVLKAKIQSEMMEEIEKHRNKPAAELVN